MSERLEVRLTGDNGVLVTFTASVARLSRLALHWSFLMRNRRRWIDDPLLSDSIGNRSRQHLSALNVQENDLIRLATCKVIEVSHNFMDSQPVLRLMPWEGFLTRATRPFRDHGTLVIYRLLQPSFPLPAVQPPLPRALYVESYPGKLRQLYALEEEREILRTYARGLDQEFLSNPTITSLSEAMLRQPGLIHISGIDSHQGAASFPGTPPPADGLWLRDEKGSAVALPFEQIATSLGASRRQARLVGLNFYNSARLAGQLVGKSALAAIAFQDFVDEDAAEIFFAKLYDRWANTANTSLLDAFESALQALSRQLHRVKGSGVTLWTTQSLIPPVGLPIFGFRAARDLEEGIYKVDIRPHDTLNYSVMHNGRKPIFSRFCVYRYGPASDEELKVRVTLQWGGESSEFAASFQWQDHLLDLSQTIRLSLTSTLARSLREAIVVTLGIHVSCGNKELYLNTLPVRLVAVDEWIDDDLNGPYLPSFVLPRDPQITRIVASAQRYLMALADNPVQGFDGYQSADGGLGVEPQVRAIWYSLQNDFGLRYVNPPPSFTASSQRLRTPTEIIEGGRGTCLDIALLLAASLEYIGLHPVIFLLKGHATVGYWTSEELRGEFLSARNSEPLSRSEDQTPLPNEEDEKEVVEFSSVFLPWHFDTNRWASVVDAIDRGGLVPIEATYLTLGRSFADAIDAADRVLRQQDDYDCMLEITLARSKSITPLPIAFAGGHK